MSSQDVIDAVQQYPEGSDLVISAFVGALSHYRRATISTPFPTHLYQTAAGEKDFTSCVKALESLPSIQQLPARFHTLPTQTRDLLSWLLLPTTRKRALFALTSFQEFLDFLKPLQLQGLPLPAFTGLLRPTTVLRNASLDDQQRFSKPVVAYHGTHTENLHSILNAGLLNLSGTKLQRTGDVFGKGIYLSVHPDVAVSFSQTCPTWRNSLLGCNRRYLLVCEVDLAKSNISGAGVEGLAAAEASVQQVKDNYLLSQPDAVRILYVLVYNDDKPASVRKAPRINWCTVLIVLYVAFIVMHGVMQSTMWRQWRNRSMYM